MNIVWFSWKGIDHPLAGGAETISWHMMQRLAADGHNVRLLTAGYPGSTARELKNGVEIIRTGSRFSVYPKTMFLFRKQLADWPDLVIDEMNTIPFACGFYTRKKSILLAYQLARQVWFFEMPFPFSIIGYTVEPIYLFMLSRRYRFAITESESTRKDLHHYGFALSKVKVFRVAIEMKPLKVLGAKKTLNNVLVLGSMRSMKRTLSAIKAFELARDSNPKLQLTLAGDSTGSYGNRVIKYISSSRHTAAIRVLGRVSSSERQKVMREATLILVTSIKEGWGLIITEANSQGTPAIAYDVDGLRDSIIDQETGILVKSGDKAALGSAINKLLKDPGRYSRLRKNAWQNSQQYTPENSYQDFLKVSGIN
jgi:glycosyltransferase involved in cell wall biosynthesis